MKLSDLQLNIGQLEGLPANPRYIEAEDFEQLKLRLLRMPQYLRHNPIKVEENNIILGGNMRYRALQALAEEHAIGRWTDKNGVEHTHNFTEEIPDEWVVQLTDYTLEDKRRIVLLDNAQNGKDDLERLANEWSEAEINDWGVPTESVTDKKEKPTEQPTTATNSKRRSTELIEVSEKFLMRRAYGEDILLQRMGIEPLKPGHSYHCITGGDVDALSFLKVVMLHAKKLKYLLCSTWCMSAEDIKQLQEWYDSGRIEKLDMYVGEIFPSTYVVEWRMLNNFYAEHPEVGRIKCFRNHSKIFAGFADEFDFAIESSANINTNPRTEQGVINISTELAQFYKDFFDKIQ